MEHRGLLDGEVLGFPIKILLVFGGGLPLLLGIHSQHIFFLLSSFLVGLRGFSFFFLQICINTEAFLYIVFFHFSSGRGLFTRGIGWSFLFRKGIA